MRFISFLVLTLFLSNSLVAKEIKLVISKKYLNIPISHKVDRKKMTFATEGKVDIEFVIRLAENKPDYWVFSDVSNYMGKELSISYDGESNLNLIFQSDTIVGEEQLYKEMNRPQFHFTTKRGWINDPNGMIYHKGLYHLYYQHNPYERDWENMHWGHAISKDLIHWDELPSALLPDELGTIYSGSTVFDSQNTSGFGSKSNPPLVAFYTSALPDKQRQSVAYSLDDGLTWTKYEKNPIIDTTDKWGTVHTRDPIVFWYEKGKHWVMVLNERDGHSIFNSSNLIDWEYKSHITGFWECPGLFELPIDNNSKKTKWVMYGASATYMIGDFDGKTFTPESGKHMYTAGAGYAAQTFNGVPKADGRRIQMEWARIDLNGMPFNGQMFLPTELSLRTTKNGVRLFSVPVKEIDLLEYDKESWNFHMTSQEATEKLEKYKDEDYLRIRIKIELSHATSAGLDLNRQRIFDYDMNSNLVNGVFYSPEDMTSMEIDADIIIDKTSIEIFVDEGAFSRKIERRQNNDNADGLHFWGENITVKRLEVSKMKSIWK